MTAWHTQIPCGTRCMGTRCANTSFAKRAQSENESETSTTYVPASMAAVRIYTSSQHGHHSADYHAHLSESWVRVAHAIMTGNEVENNGVVYETRQQWPSYLVAPSSREAIRMQL